MTTMQTTTSLSKDATSPQRRAANTATASGADFHTDDMKHFTFEVDERGVALVHFDLADAKMNTLSPKVEGELLSIVERLEKDASIVAAVFASAKPGNFIAGADIEMLQAAKTAEEASELARSLQRAFERVEALHAEQGKPVVAAIDGSCLGGGLEFALACSMRVCSNAGHTLMGLPEVKLGLFPGAGGTQRLPALIGIAHALDLILTGRNVRPRKALKLGLVDEITPPGVLIEIAKNRAFETASGRVAAPKRGLKRLQELWAEAPDILQKLALEDNPAGQALLFKKAKESLLKKTRGNYPAPERALQVVRTGIQNGLTAGFSAEAEEFGKLAVSSEAKALMSIFFATQALKKDNGTDKKKVKVTPIKNMVMLGGGFMGGGIAAVSTIKAGAHVRIKDISDGGVALGMGYVGKLLDKDVKRRFKRRLDADRVMGLLTGTTGNDGLEHAQLVIEAVFEDLQLKQRVLKDVEAICGDDTIFASNTSSLPITKIAEASAHPETVIGMHYFSPVEKMPLLEIITTKDTADEVTATCVAFGKRQGKTVIVVRDGTGFYTSRILAPYLNEAAWMLSEGADIRAIDNALCDWGFPVGPITLLDEVGIEVGAKVAGILEEAFGTRLKAPESMTAVHQDGRKGRKNHKGFFVYDDKGKKGGVDESVYAVFGQSKKRITLAPQEIQQRIGLQMISEAARCLEEGILRSPRDGDIGAVFGLGFPPFTGGPFAYLDLVGTANVVDSLQAYADKHGERFTPPQILLDYKKSNKKFRGE